MYQRELENGNETQAEKVSSEEVLDRKLGVAALVANRAREAYEQIESLKITVNRLDAELLQQAIPHVIVEGVTDKTIMEEAYRKLYPEDEPICEFVHAGGATNIPPYLKSAKYLSKEFSHPVIGLFDRDQEGRKQMKEFAVGEPIDATGFYEISSDRKLYAGLLALPEVLHDIEEQIKPSLGNDINLPVPIEFMFPAEVISEALSESVIELEDRIAKANDPELPTTINLSDLYSNHLPEGYEYLAKKVKKNTKTSFSNWVADQPVASFENFRQVFEQLKIVTGTGQGQ